MQSAACLDALYGIAYGHSVVAGYRCTHLSDGVQIREGGEYETRV